MGKRKDVTNDPLAASKQRAGADPDNSDSDSDANNDVTMVDVDFEWFNMNPDIDFHSIKLLLRQLLDVDNDKFDLSALADLICGTGEKDLGSKWGSTVKTDGEEGDPYAFITAVDLEEYKVRVSGGDDVWGDGVWSCYRISAGARMVGGYYFEMEAPSSCAASHIHSLPLQLTQQHT